MGFRTRGVARYYWSGGCRSWLQDVGYREGGREAFADIGDIGRATQPML